MNTTKIVEYLTSNYDTCFNLVFDKIKNITKQYQETIEIQLFVAESNDEIEFKVLTVNKDEAVHYSKKGVFSYVLVNNKMSVELLKQLSNDVLKALIFFANNKTSI